MNYLNTPCRHLNLSGFGGRTCARESCQWYRVSLRPSKARSPKTTLVPSLYSQMDKRQDRSAIFFSFFLAFLSETHIYYTVWGESETGIQDFQFTAKHLQIKAIYWLSGSLLDSFKSEEGPVFKTDTHNNVNTLQLCTSVYGGCAFASKIWLVQTEGAFIA